MTTRPHLLRFAVCSLLFAASTAHAQFELKAGNFNSLFVDTNDFPTVFNPPPTDGQFAGMGQVSGSSGPIDATPDDSQAPGAIATDHADMYPSTGDNAMVLVRSTIGNVFASGVPRYFMGDEITPPLVQADGVTNAPAGYWREKPVLPGESIPGLGVLIPAINVLAYYYSPHSEKVYASQPGRVTITWVTRLPDAGGNYASLLETFAVSATTERPVRPIFWTEAGFDSPVVRITDARITTVNPAYYPSVPETVLEEVDIPGADPLFETLTTLSFDKLNGVGQLHAYNVEGRIFIEYLGNVRLGDDIYESIGTDVVEIKRVPPVSFVTVNLGTEITPHDDNPLLRASPVLSGLQNAATYYGTTVRPDGSSAYFAERETSPANDPDDGFPASPDAYNKVFFYWMETGAFSIQWPKFQDRYWQRWSPDLADYAHYTVDSSGSTPATGVPFTGGSLPQIVYQDDPAQAEAQIDLSSQRLVVTFDPAGPDLRNRSLLRFSSSGNIWYVNLYTQTEDRQQERTADANGTTTVTLTGAAPTVGLEVGMVVTGSGITGTATILSIIDTNHVELSQSVSIDSTYTFTVESDAASPIDTTATVGDRIPPPAGHEIAGYISAGTGYYPAGYLDPFVVGVDAANLGAIIPVNAPPADNRLTVRWFKRIPAPSAGFQDLHVPGKIGRYTVSYPAVTDPQIVIAQGVGTDDLSASEAAGTIYYQNDSALPGFNPNEEHAFMLGGRAYALREDLNVTTPTYTSKPFVLVAYTDPADDRPALHAYQVVRTNETYAFDYTATAGTLLVKPYPLPVLPLPLAGEGAERTSKDLEIVGADNPSNETVSADAAYTDFTFKDRKGFTWIHRGPHDGGSPTLTMKLYYLSRAGFFIPGAAVPEPEVGTVLPFLRTAARSGQTLDISAIDNGQPDEPLEIVYRPTWPEQAAELRVGETLTLPKFGLPQVRGQVSAQVLYQQSIALAETASGRTKNSVTLHDPTREKTVALEAVGLEELPAAIRTSSYLGKTYFQGLPPHLQQRLFLDPLRGAKGTLIFIGNFHDEIAGEDYIDLNLLTAAEEDLLKGLVPSGAADDSEWVAAIEALNTEVETFIPDPAQFGSYIVGSTRDEGENDLAAVTDPDTAVDSYAVTATGQGIGWVTMVFGNGNAFTPEGDPVVVQVFRIAEQLYVGDLKVVLSSNPLDEQVTLRHSGDYAGRPEDYEFEWRWATGEASAPATYLTTMTKRIGDPVTTSHNWVVVSDPGALLPTAAQYSAAGAAVPFPSSRVVSPESDSEVDRAADYPGLVAKSSVGMVFSNGVPGNIVFSAELGALDGCVLYVNGVVALAHNAPTPRFTLTSASAGLTETGLGRQFSIAPGYFTAGSNTIEVAVYTTADPNTTSTLDFVIEAAEEEDNVLVGNDWETPGGQTTNMFPHGASVIVGGPPVPPFGGPQFVLNDRWFTMRYRPTAGADNVLGTPWSRWMPPQFVEGWIKRVLAAINPFEQRVKDLFNNEVNTDVSVITQAGTRWEGDIALTLENINDVGLIAIYETVLNRAKSMSIDANTNDPDSNNALLLVAGYLNDLYVLLGNEAFADAANPTISLDDATSAIEVNSSRFSFETQVASSLEEELALLRGRDDFISPGVATAPAYNRLYWNYTHGINGGEVIYAVNYNIKEKAGSSTADGVIDESDAQRMFPQGHGDAYGHYLTALTGYYQLLANDNFTWTPRAEAVTVLGQPVTVDFLDERKFAAAAGNVARAAQQIVALVHRQAYADDPADGWSHFRDPKGSNPQTGVTSRQGLDEWVSRSTQGAFFHWAVANALVPDEDIVHTGIQKIDRTTVPEIPQLVAAAETFQTAIDNASAHLNPLGLSPGAIAFDISPGEMLAGQSHFEQVYDRTLQSLVNAAGAFNQAASMTRSLRNQQNQVDDYTASIVQEERAYVNQLIDIFGRPYSGEIGPGKTYAQGYAGPDLLHWFIVDRPNDLVDTADSFMVTLPSHVEYKAYTGSSIDDILATLEPESAYRTVTVQPSQFVQYNDVWQEGGLGSRAETGALQDALQDAQQTFLALANLSGPYTDTRTSLDRATEVFKDLVRTHRDYLETLGSSNDELLALEKLVRDREIAAQSFNDLADIVELTGNAIAEIFPHEVGFSTDITSSARGAVLAVAAAAADVFKVIALATEADARAQETNILEEEQSLEERLLAIEFDHEELALAYEFDTLYRELIGSGAELMQFTLAHQRALQQVLNVIARGNRILAEREVFRQRAAAIIQGHRTQDLGFRLFRNEALEQYRSLFDLAGRYTYLAAKSYDYETGLLGTTQGQSVFADIVSSRSLGDLTGGVPQSTSSTLGDTGLAGTMAQLNAEFSVAEGRLGINNPDQYGTVFSLRGELYRLLDDPAITGDDVIWQQTLEQHIMANVLTDSDVATYCRNIRKPDGTPVPGIVIPFSTTIEHGNNFFGLPLAAGDHAYTPSSFATKIYNVGLVLPGYVGMDAYAAGNPGGAPASNDPYALSATPYVYLIPCGNDTMLAPPLGDSNLLRSWTVHDQALPLPYNLGANDFNSTQFFNANGTLSEQPWIIRKHQAFRAVEDPTLFYGLVPTEFSNSRLIGRSVWNSQWKIVIPAYTLLNDEQAGLDRFTASVKDIQLFLRTYSHSGN